MTQATCCEFRKADPEDIEWFLSKMSVFPSSQFSGMVATISGQRAAMVGFDLWTKTAVSVHILCEDFRALVPLWREMLQYLRSHGRFIVYGTTPADNETSLKLQRALGFQEVYRQKDGWDLGTDMIVCEYRNDGQKRTEGS
jgi:hypothetical protein